LIALATGRAETGERLALGAAIDRAAALVRGPRPQHAGIRIDTVTAGLLDERFERVDDEYGAVLVGRRDVDAVRTLLGKPTPCVGRETELAMLQSIVEQCLTEPGSRAVVVTAQAGVGKSRLRHELIQVRLDEPFEICCARPVGAEAHSACHAVVRALRDLRW
jgi:hypothetical protein